MDPQAAGKGWARPWLPKWALAEDVFLIQEAACAGAPTEVSACGTSTEQVWGVGEGYRAHSILSSCVAG